MDLSRCSTLATDLDSFAQSADIQDTFQVLLQQDRGLRGSQCNVHVHSLWVLFKYLYSLISYFVVCTGLMRVRRVEVHPKVAGQPLPALLQTVMPRLQKDKQLKSDAIQNAENAIADMVSKGEPFAGRLLQYITGAESQAHFDC